MHGFGASDRRRYAALAGASDVFYVQDALHNCDDLIYEPLPKPPVEVGVLVHWFLVEGVKPRTPENAVPRQLLELTRPPLPLASDAQASRAALDTAAPAAAQHQQSTYADILPAGAADAAQDGSAHAQGLDAQPAAILPVAQHVVSEEQTELMRIFRQVRAASAC